MSEESQTITTPAPPREKDPKRVEAGRQLGKISQAAKEKKMRAKIEAEMEEERKAQEDIEDTVPSDKTSEGMSIGNIVGIAGLLLAIYATFFQETKEPTTTKAEVIDKAPPAMSLGGN